jgi:hypothetical protein
LTEIIHNFTFLPNSIYAAIQPEFKSETAFIVTKAHSNVMEWLCAPRAGYS